MKTQINEYLDNFQEGMKKIFNDKQSKSVEVNERLVLETFSSILGAAQTQFLTILTQINRDN